MSSTFIAKGADGYDQYMGRWTATRSTFLDFAGVADGERIIRCRMRTGSLNVFDP